MSKLGRPFGKRNKKRVPFNYRIDVEARNAFIGEAARRGMEPRDLIEEIGESFKPKGSKK